MQPDRERDGSAIRIMRGACRGGKSILGAWAMKVMDSEPATNAKSDGVVYHGPACRCGSRNTRLIHGLRRFCHSCNRVFELRVESGELLAFEPVVAEGIDKMRAGAL